MLPFLASFARLLRWTSLGGRSLPKGNSLPSRSSALPSGKISGEIFRRTFLAVRTGLEPATPGVTGRYSNQLNYRTIVQAMNFEPMEGIEPTTPRLQITCSGQLSYIGNIVSRLKAVAFVRDCKGRHIF